MNGGGGGSDSTTATSSNETISNSSTTSSSQSPSSAVLVVIIVVASALLISLIIYLVVRLLHDRQRRRSHALFPPSTPEVVLSLDRDRNRNNRINSSCFNHHNAVSPESILDSLPLFSFGKITGNLTGGDCAVCLSKFEPQDQLRLLPLCCHAFHACCIDAWLASNLTCPLCRSPANPTDSDVLTKILSDQKIQNTANQNTNTDGRSFRLELGSVSVRRGGSESGRRSYSIGQFEYILNDGCDVSVDCTHRRSTTSARGSVDKEQVGVPVAAAPGERVVEEAGGGVGGSWLRDYVDRIGSLSFSRRTLSIRSSGRFFAGSSRRSDVVIPVEDLEGNGIGEEISELFGWFSRV